MKKVQQQILQQSIDFLSGVHQTSVEKNFTLNIILNGNELFSGKQY